MQSVLCSCAIQVNPQCSASIFKFHENVFSVSGGFTGGEKLGTGIQTEIAT
jgi:hypothetical protein